MGIFGGIGQGGRSDSIAGGRSATTRQPGLRPARAGTVAVGTLACPRCDAPVAAGAGGLALTDRLSCPFCRHGAPVRDFLSLAVPTRPARVVVRLGFP